MNIRAMTTAGVAVLSLGLGLTAVPGGPPPVEAQDKPAQPKTLGDFREALRVETESKARQVRELAAEVMPSAEQLRENGDWKFPWQIPEGVGFPLFSPARHCTTLLENSFSGPTFLDIALGRPPVSRSSPEESYWASLAPLQTVFVGLSGEAAAARLNALEKNIKKGEQPILDLLPLEHLFGATGGTNPTIPTLVPTLSVTVDRASALRKLLMEMNRENMASKKPPVSREERERRSLAVLYPGLNDRQLRDYVIQSLTLTRRSTMLYYFRTNKPEALPKIGAAVMLRGKLLHEYREKPGRYEDPRWKESFDQGHSWLAMDRGQVSWSVVVVHVRQVAPDCLDDFFKDLTAEEAQGLEARLNARHKEMIELARPWAEDEIKGAKRSLEKYRQSADPDIARNGVIFYEAFLPKLEACWRANLAATYKVRLLDKGTNSYVISTRQAASLDLMTNDVVLLWRQLEVGIGAVILHAATIRNGVCVADVEVMSTMSEAEANKDLEFFLNVMHENTLKYRGP